MIDSIHSLERLEHLPTMDGAEITFSKFISEWICFSSTIKQTNKKINERINLQLVQFVWYRDRMDQQIAMLT